MCSCNKCKMFRKYYFEGRDGIFIYSQEGYCLYNFRKGMYIGERFACANIIKDDN